MKTIKKVFLIIAMSLSINGFAQNVVENVYYEPELLMVSQPTMQFYSVNDYDYAKLYFDVQNIGSETYKGDFMILLEPDQTHYYAVKNISVKSGKIKRIRVEVDLSQCYYDSIYTVVPVYEYRGEFYPLTMYEDFKSLAIYVKAPEVYNTYIVVTPPPVPTYYYYDVRLHRPYVYGYYSYVTPLDGWGRPYGVIPPYGLPHYYHKPNYQKPVAPPQNNNNNNNNGQGLHVSGSGASSLGAGTNISARKKATTISNNGRPRPSARPSSVSGNSSPRQNQSTVNQGSRNNNSNSGSVRPNRSSSNNSGSSRPASSINNRNNNSNRSNSNSSSINKSSSSSRKSDSPRSNNSSKQGGSLRLDNPKRR